MNYFPQITLLVTHYNRSASLKRLLKTFKELSIIFGEIIVSDDGSEVSHRKALNHLQEAFEFKLITASTNCGLGHNINKGQNAVKTSYTLYVQEDFEPQAKFVEILRQSILLMETDKDLDLVRYFAHFRYPYLKPYSGNFEIVSIPALATDYNKIYAYADTPHLRRSSFCQKFGWYAERINSDRMEYKMCIRFIQKKGKCLIHKDFKTIFLHENLEEEQSTVSRPQYQRNSGPFTTLARYIYRQLRYNFDIFFS